VIVRHGHGLQKWGSVTQPYLLRRVRKGYKQQGQVRGAQVCKAGHGSGPNDGRGVVLGGRHQNQGTLSGQEYNRWDTRVIVWSWELRGITEHEDAERNIRQGRMPARASLREQRAFLTCGPRVARPLAAACRTVTSQSLRPACSWGSSWLRRSSTTLWSARAPRRARDCSGDVATRHDTSFRKRMTHSTLNRTDTRLSNHALHALRANCQLQV
jgi:hypothetical protein